MTTLFQQKSTLARLLAQENINVEHRKTSTAYFDLESRTMVLPIWKIMDGVVYDLLVGHEVGHAEFTPKQGWHDAVTANKALKSYLNVIEDARIERKIKDKYPGLRRQFIDAYKQLHDMDFFGLKDRDVNKLKLIDRINIFYKLGAHVRVPFSPEELKFIDRINAAETWDDVESVANDIFAYAKEQRENETDQPNSVEDQDDEDDINTNDDVSDDTSDDDSDEESGEFADDSNDESDDESNDDSDEKSDKPSNGSVDNSDDDSLDEDDSDDSLKSETDDAFRRNESTLIDSSTGNTHVAPLPVFDRGAYLVPYKFVHQKITDHINQWILPVYPGLTDKMYENYTLFNNRTNRVVNYMIKEFEMRKNASQLARAKIGKSGKINPRRLARYNLDQDIFQRITTVGEGKNHGMFIIIDLSGSMMSNLKKTLEQTLILTNFCRKANIPFEVYGFSDSEKSYHQFKSVGALNGKPFAQHERNDFFMHNPHFHLKQYLSSTMSAAVYRASAINLLYVGAAHARDFYRAAAHPLPCTEDLSSTPLNESIAVSIDLVSEFKAAYRLDIVNAIFLTDGAGECRKEVFVGPEVFHRNYINADDSLYIEHRPTKVKVKVEYKARQHLDNFQVSRALVEIAKQVTGAKYTGYYISYPDDVFNVNYDYEYTRGNREVVRDQRTQFKRKLRDNGFFSSDKFGFDEYFFVIRDNMDVRNVGIQVDKDAKKGAISRAFSNSLSARNLQRMFLNRFVQNLAV